MPNPQLKRTEDDLPAMSPSDTYAPKKYSAREHALMGVKVVFFVGLLLGLLWLVDAMAAK